MFGWRLQDCCFALVGEAVPCSLVSRCQTKPSVTRKARASNCRLVALVKLDVTDGCIKVTDIKRHSTDEERWNPDVFNSVSEVHWGLVPGSGSCKINVKISAPRSSEDIRERLVAEDRPYVARGCSIHLFRVATPFHNPQWYRVCSRIFP